MTGKISHIWSENFRDPQILFLNDYETKNRPYFKYFPSELSIVAGRVPEADVISPHNNEPLMFILPEWSLL
jgi:hypothetical protein